MMISIKKLSIMFLSYIILVLQLAVFLQAEGLESSVSNHTDEPVVENIEGGHWATKKEILYMALIKIKVINNHYRYCAGSFIGLDAVLTSASCVTNPITGELEKLKNIFVAGNFFNLHNTANTEICLTENVTMSDRYNIDKTTDIAMIKLKCKHPLNLEKVYPLTISKKTPANGDRCIFSGWGNSKGILRTLDLSVRSDNCPKCSNPEHCKTYVALNPHTICGFSTYVVDRGCEGDIGGPLVCDGKLVGVATGYMRKGKDNCGLPIKFVKCTHPDLKTSIEDMLAEMGAHRFGTSTTMGSTTTVSTTMGSTTMESTTTESTTIPPSSSSTTTTTTTNKPDCDNSTMGSTKP